MNKNLIEHKPVKPFLKYVGSKSWLAKRIINMMPAHTCYCEPFGGMGAVLLAKPKSKVEVWNDIDGELANVMRIVRYHPEALAEEMQWMLIHRGERLHWRDYPGETDIQRAARWIMVRHTGFGGVNGIGFHVGKKAAIKPRENLIEQMRAVSKRLSGVCIENLDWRRVFDLYDSPQTLFFCDPPYADGDQSMYENPFNEDSHRELAERLQALQGHWILTYGDHPIIRELYAGCRIEEVQRARKINQKFKMEYTELVITPVDYSANLIQEGSLFNG